jgi:hypothetical protein
MAIVREDVGVHKHDRLLLYPRGVPTEEAKQRAHTRCTKVYMPPRLLAHHARYDSMGYDKPYPNGPHDYCGPTKA